MDVFVQNVPLHATDKQLEEAFRSPLAECGAQIFHCKKMVEKQLAVVTVLDSLACVRFLGLYGVPRHAARWIKPARSLAMGGSLLRCSQSDRPVREFTVRSLAHEASQKAAKAIKAASNAAAQGPASNSLTTKFSNSRIRCGIWEYAGTQLAFQEHYGLAISGSVTFGTKEAVILLGGRDEKHTRIYINYYSCDNIILGTFDDPSVSFTVRTVPKLYAVEVEDLSDAMGALTMSSRARRTQQQRSRLLAIDAAHGRVAGFCPVYRITLTHHQMLSTVRSLLSRYRSMPPVLSLPTSILIPSFGGMIERSFDRLTYELTDTQRFGNEPFSVRYQLTRLATNAILSPPKVQQLLPKVRILLRTYGLDATLSGLRRFSREVPLAGPDTEAAHCSAAALDQLLETCTLCYDRHAPENPYEIAKRHAQIILVHRVVITPTSMYLAGPEPEPTNRVLRRWAKHTDHFIRVVFHDEDGTSVRYDSRATQGDVFHVRFKTVLDTSILIAGQGFSFLGFSGSSLRGQSCWFMAPMVLDGTLVYADNILRELGDFSNIRVAAKCAARIGQNFTDTNATVDLDPCEVFELPNVERNGRDFSDGVGTISLELLKEVWKVYGKKRLLKPTALQIRFQGAKGMVALDTRLRGRKLMIRANMRKFETYGSWNLEICGAAFRPLPMFLNRQFIKVLEDLGVPEASFMELQQAAIDGLRCMTTSAVNTATLLEDMESPKVTKLPTLIKMLGDIGLDYHEDHFLYSVVEMAVVTKLRDIKYRGRIRVHEGVTLYGIMDETGFLSEGEVYVVTESIPEGGRDVWEKTGIAITRSPVMHPGDIQLVNAVNVPPSSPLQKLSNVVVFSQHGARDLPSQLGGGDLDGDMYNVIYDPRLLPRRTYNAAAYPRVKPAELARAVTRKDMSDWFVTFMENDVLGMLCTAHLQVADQKPDGTCSKECVQLAGMASVAVDFSKTGIPVERADMPRRDPSLPDFMAPSPWVFINQQGYSEMPEEDVEEDAALGDLDTAMPAKRYYESSKVLGKLYRNIDEHIFLANMQRQHQAIIGDHRPSNDVLTQLLEYMKLWVRQYGIIYSHHATLARDIQASYEDAILNIAYQCAPSMQHPVSEQEIYAGNILGRQTGPQGKPLREQSKVMRERFGNVVDYAVAHILKGERAIQAEEDPDDVYNDREFEALPRAVACLEVAVQDEGLSDRKLGELKSFGYVAAVMCLTELQRYRITTFGSYTLPRV